MIDIVVGIDPGHCTGYAVLLVPNKKIAPVIFENGIVPFYPNKGRTTYLFDFWTRLFQRLPACHHLIFCYEANVGASFGSSFFYATEQATNIIMGDLVWRKLQPSMNATLPETIAINNVELGRLFGISSKGTKRRPKSKDKSKDKEKIKIRPIRDLLREAVMTEFGLDNSGLVKSIDAWDAIVLARACIYKVFGNCKEDTLYIAICDQCDKMIPAQVGDFNVCGCGNIMIRCRNEVIIEVRLRNTRVKDLVRVVGFDRAVKLGHQEVGQCSILPWDYSSMIVQIMEIEHREKKEKDGTDKGAST